MVRVVLAEQIAAGTFLEWRPKKITRAFEIKPQGYLEVEAEYQGPTRGKQFLTWTEVFDAVKRIAPEDGKEIVSWMHEAYANKLIVLHTIEAYNQYGGFFERDSGDAYIPGVTVSDAAFLSTYGTKIREQGYAIGIYSNDNYSVPLYRRVFSYDLIVQWLVSHVYALQWTGLIGRLRQAISLPWSGTLPLGNVQTENGNYVTFPSPVFAYQLGLLRRVVLVEADFPKPATLRMDFCANAGYCWTATYHADQPGTYNILVLAKKAPASGYILVSADGVDTPPVLNKMQVGVKVFG